MYICFDRYELRKPIIYLSQKNFPDMASLRRYALWITFIFIFIFIWGIFLRGIIKNCYCLELRHLRKRIWRIHFPSDELWRIFDLLLNFNQFPFSGLETHNTKDLLYSTVHLFLTDPDQSKSSNDLSIHLFSVFWRVAINDKLSNRKRTKRPYRQRQFVTWSPMRDWWRLINATKETTYACKFKSRR